MRRKVPKYRVPQILKGDSDSYLFVPFSYYQTIALLFPENYTLHLALRIGLSFYRKNSV
jgi:hypothetical protein